MRPGGDARAERAGESAIRVEALTHHHGKLRVGAAVGVGEEGVTVAAPHGQLHQYRRGGQVQPAGLVLGHDDMAVVDDGAVLNELRHTRAP